MHIGCQTGCPCARARWIPGVRIAHREKRKEQCYKHIHSPATTATVLEKKNENIIMKLCKNWRLSAFELVAFASVSWKMNNVWMQFIFTSTNLYSRESRVRRTGEVEEREPGDKKLSKITPKRIYSHKVTILKQDAFRYIGLQLVTAAANAIHQDLKALTLGQF